jgi:NAD+ kinase
MKKGAFRRAMVYARQHRATKEVNETLQNILQLLPVLGVDGFLDVETQATFQLAYATIKRTQLTPSDIIIVVGGDGTILSASQFAIETNTPVIGINRGHLGFLTDISPQSIEQQLKPILEGKYKEEQRFLLKASILTSNEYDSKSVVNAFALNDWVLSRGNNTHLVSFDVFVNDECISHYRADGFIIATPTGSTAYALSAGGPIMHPDLNAIVMVPMFCHSLSSRPLVVSGNATIRLSMTTNHETPLTLSADGQDPINVESHEHILIEKHSSALRLLHPKHYRYYDTLRTKLGWDNAHQG